MSKEKDVLTKLIDSHYGKGSAAVRLNIRILAKKYAEECIKASLEKAADRFIDPGEGYKQIITSEENIVLL